MTVYQTATSYLCDYPGCQSVGDKVAPDKPPAGWLHLDDQVMKITNTVGLQLVDFCSLHATAPISHLAELIYRETGHA
jgi:hypothetical protein